MCFDRICNISAGFCASQQERGPTMTFEEILDQAIDMLWRRGRLTYGALKRQFQLDEAYLNDLKEELIEGQRLAVDEQGKVLVWMGERKQTATPPPAALPASINFSVMASWPCLARR
jgi:hypothetical protein